MSESQESSQRREARFDFSRELGAIAAAPRARIEGRVKEAVGQVVEIEGVDASVGSELEIVSSGLRLEVLGFRNGLSIAAPLGDIAGVSPGQRVRLASKKGMVPVGDALLGRVIDAFGRPLDGKPAPQTTATTPVQCAPPSPFLREPISQVFSTGVRAIDALLPMGRGQRVGLFAGAGVGKSTLLGMMVRSAKVDIVVVALIGERGRELGEFVRHALGEEGLAKSVVVAATSDMPPLMRVRASLTATAIAEHYRALGMDVLLVMDSLTRFAMALREATLAAGEPPLTKGYTPSVFAALPALLERAGCGTKGQGSITAIYTVLMEGDDLADPVADAVKGILDGHFVLSRTMADRGIFPAIDILRSISRVAPDVASKDQMTVVSKVRDLLSALEESADLVRIGAYVPGSDPRIDEARVAAPKIEAMIKQGHRETVTPRDAFMALANVLK